MKKIALGIVLLLSLCVAQAKAVYPFEYPAQQQQFLRLTDELRCLVCQNENLASSNAALAADLRHDVYVRVKAGQTDKQIKQYMVSKYGDFILFKPLFDSSTWVLWLGPFALLLIGVIVVLSIAWRRSKAGKK